MNHKVCHVIGAGDFFPSISIDPQDFLIAADGGYLHAHKAGWKPHLVIGDFDSLAYPPQNQTLIRLPREKDDTDMMAALKEGLKRGYRLFYIHGGSGGRIDHTIANLQCLSYLVRQDARGFLFTEDTILTCICNETRTFDNCCSGMLSVFAVTDQAEGVTLSGFKYSLQDATLSNDFPVGVSNEFIGCAGSVTVKKGILLVSFQMQKNLDLKNYFM